MSRWSVVRQIREDGLTYEWVVTDFLTGQTIRTMSGTRQSAIDHARWLRQQEEKK